MTVMFVLKNGSSCIGKIVGTFVVKTMNLLWVHHGKACEKAQTEKKYKNESSVNAHTGALHDLLTMLARRPRRH